MRAQGTSLACLQTQHNACNDAPADMHAGPRVPRICDAFLEAPGGRFSPVAGACRQPRQLNARRLFCCTIHWAALICGGISRLSWPWPSTVICWPMTALISAGLQLAVKRLRLNSSPLKNLFLACGLVQSLTCLGPIRAVSKPQQPIPAFKKPSKHLGAQKKQQLPQFPEDKPDRVPSSAQERMDLVTPKCPKDGRGPVCHPSSCGRSPARSRFGAFSSFFICGVSPRLLPLIKTCGAFSL